MGKKFNLSKRRSEHIDKKNLKITIFDLDDILNTYLTGINSIKTKISKIKEKKKKKRMMTLTIYLDLI